jgi:hypothetical protein
MNMFVEESFAHDLVRTLILKDPDRIDEIGALALCDFANDVVYSGVGPKAKGVQVPRPNVSFTGLVIVLKGPIALCQTILQVSETTIDGGGFQIVLDGLIIFSPRFMLVPEAIKIFPFVFVFPRDVPPMERSKGRSIFQVGGNGGYKGLNTSFTGNLKDVLQIFLKVIVDSLEARLISADLLL